MDQVLGYRWKNAQQSRSRSAGGTLGFFAVLFGCLFPFSLFAEAWTVESLSEALAVRSEEDRGRDAARQPAEVLVAAGIGRGMTVMDLASSGGWYAEGPPARGRRSPVGRGRR